MLTGGADGEIRVWEVESGKQILNFRGHNHWASSVAFSPDGSTIASCSYSAVSFIISDRTPLCKI